MEGFMVHRWLHCWDEGIKTLAKWIEEGKIQVKETVVEGFEKTPEALIGMLNGDNIGKMVVKA